MKKLFIGLLALILCGCNTATSAPTVEATSSSDGCSVSAPCDEGTPADMSVYETYVGDKDIFFLSSMEEAVTTIENKEDAILYFGFSTCPWCLEAVPILYDVANSLGLTIHYINVRPDGTKENDLRNEDNPSYVKLQEIFLDAMPEDDDGSHRISVPFVAIIVDGEVIDHYYNYDYDAHERQMTEEEKNTVTEIYTTMMKNYKEKAGLN